MTPGALIVLIAGVGIAVGMSIQNFQEICWLRKELARAQLMALENRKTIAGILRWAEERGATVRFKERDSR